jgi:tetratricopeptide (TPR) repeat protein
MPQVEPARSSRHRLVLWGVLAGVLVLAAAGYLLWRLFPTAADTVKQADALNAKRQYLQADALLTSAYGRALTDSDRALIRSRQAATATNRGDAATALGYYQDQNRLQPGQVLTLINIAEAAERLNRKTVAADAYRQAADLLKKGPKGVTTDAQIEQYEARVKSLESGS